MNHETYDERLQLVKGILRDFSLEPAEISPLGYEADCPFPYNNFIYKISLVSPATAANFAGTQPCTVSPPKDVSDLVVRLSNYKAEGLVHDNRTENEVAAIDLARRGFAVSNPGLVSVLPAIFAWKPSSETTYGSIVMDFKPGLQLNEVYVGLSADEKTAIFGQIADILGAIQRAPLPESLKGHFGGLAISKKGDIIPGKMTTLRGGPWTSYMDLWKTKFGDALAGADKSELIGGWKKEDDGNLRDSIDRFVEHGLEAYFQRNGIDSSAQGLVHGDFTTWNMLFDMDSKKITALVDFEFSCVSHPAEEFLTSYSDLWAGLGHAPEGDTIVEAVLSGTFDNVDTATLPEEDQAKLFEAKTLDTTAKNRGLLRPSTVPGTQALRRLALLLQQVAPMRLVHSHFTKNKTAEALVEARKAALEALTTGLAKLQQV